MAAARRARAQAVCLLSAALSAPAGAQVAPYKLAEADLAIDGLAAEAQGASPVVPKNTASGLRVVVRAGGRVLSAQEAEAFLGAGFAVRAELAGPGLRRALSLPLPDAPPADDPLLLRVPGLTAAGDYTLSGLRITAGSAAGGRTLLDVAPRQLTLRVIEQVLVTSVRTRPLTLAELHDRGVLLDGDSYLGFEFTVALLLESEPVQISLPVVFNREGVPMPPVIPLPPPVRREQAPLIVPVLFQAVEGDEPPGEGDSGGGAGGGDGGLGGPSIPSVLVFPGRVGYLKQHFSAQLFTANGAPAGSGLSVRDVTAAIHLPAGADAAPGTDDDPLVLAPLVEGTPSATLPVRGVGPDGEPGTADDVGELAPGALGQAEFLLRGEREGFHNLSFDLAAVLDGLATGPVSVTGRALGGVLVRNARFDMTFVLPSVVRTQERFKLLATVHNVGRSDALDLSVSLDRSRLSGARLLAPADGTVHIPTLAAGDARVVEFELESQRTGQVVASYLHFDGGGGGRLNFAMAVDERGMPLSPDTLVMPTSLEGLPPEVVAAAMRVLGQAWSAAMAPPERRQASVLPIAEAAVREKAIALAEAGLRVQLGQPAAAAVRDLAFDLHGGARLDPGFDQLLRETDAGRNLGAALGQALAGAVQSAGGPAAYERASSEVAASGPHFLAASVRGTGAAVGVALSDGAGRRSALARSATEPALAEVPGAVLLPLGPAATAPVLALLTAPVQAPYLLKVTGPAEVSVTFPRGDGTYRRGVATTQHPARVAMDFGSLALAEDTDGDGTYETPRDLALETLTSQGPRLLSATVVGPETLRGASVYGVNAALLFDRAVGEESAADKARYQIPSNQAQGARRQLSGRMVFLGLAQPEGRYLPTTLATDGVEDIHGVAGPAATVPLTSRLDAPGAVVSGRVVNADGTPFAGGLVHYSQYHTNHNCVLAGAVVLVPVAAVRADESGRYELRYVPRDPCGLPFEVAVHDPVTGAKRSVQLYVRTAGEQIVADLALVGRGTVTGVVRDAAGEAVGGALVVAHSVTDAAVAGHHTTNGDGRYTIRNVTVGGVNVRAVRGIHVGQAAGRIERAGATASIDVRLEGGSARLSGRVFKLEAGHTTPLPAAHVQYRLASDDALLGVAQTEAGGRYVLQGMPAGNFRLRVNLNTRDWAEVTGHAAEGQALDDLDLVVVVPPEAELGSVRGTVRLHDGTPAARAVVWTHDRAVLTADDGTYLLSGLPVPSNPMVLARPRIGDRMGTTYALITAANPHATGVDISLPGDGAAQFTVLDPAGSPIANQAVSLLGGGCASACGCGTKYTNELGQVRFEGLRLGFRSALALRTVDGVQDAAQATVNVEREGQTAYGVLRFGGAGTVRGVVRQEGSGTPVHGAQVRLKSATFVRDMWTCGLAYQWTQQATTQVDGSFAFRGVHAGRVQAFATQPFFGQAWGGAEGTVAHGQEASLQISLRNTMAGGLSGTIVLPDGVTPAGSGVSVTVNGVLPDVTVSTGDDGRYEFAEVLPEGHYTMTVSHPDSGGVARQRLYLRAQQDAVHDVRLLGRGAVQLAVADGGDEVVESASVRLRQTEYPFRIYDGVVEPATQGVVRFEDVVEGPFTIEASDVYGRGGRGWGEIGRPGETVSVRVRLTVTGIVSGRFLMPDSSPIPYGTVRLTAGGRAIGQVVTQSTGQVGSFAFDYVPAGQVRLEAEDPATARTGLAVGALESEDQQVALDVRAQALGTVRGLVTGDGTPQPGALVQIVSGAYRVNTAADSDGRYQVPGIPEGRITVTASLEGGYLLATVSGTLSGEGSVLDLDVALRPSGEVHGTVTGADGATPARAAISAYASGAGGGLFSRHTTEDGRFEFERLAAGSAVLKADRLGSIDRTQATVDVPPGGTVEVPLRLNGVGSLSGQARGSSGAPTRGYLALSGGAAFPWTFWAQLGPDGGFFLPEALAGPVTATLRVDSGGFSLYGSASGTILPDQETVLDVQVQPSGTVTGVALRAGRTSPAFGATVTLLHERGTVRVQAQADGRFTFRGVPLGVFSLTVHDEVTTGRAKVRDRQVASNGQTVDLGVIELDAVPPSIDVLEPADGSSRPPLGGAVAVDLADAETGIDTASFAVVYPNGARQPASEFVFAGGRATGHLRREWQVVGSNRLRFEAQDQAGNLTQRTVTYTATGATLRGQVRLHDGTPVAGAVVDFGSGAPAVTQAGGGYVRGGFRAGTYWVRATDQASGMSSGYETVVVYDGEDRSHDVTLPAFGRITGVVRRAGGAAAPGTVISSGLRSATAGQGGVFDLGAFALGPHHLSAVDVARGDRATALVTITNPGQMVTAEIRLSGVGTVAATVKNANGTVVSGALVKAFSSAAAGWNGTELATPASGTVSWSQALAGTITVTARDPVRNLAGQASGVLQDDGSLALTVTLQAAASVRGTVYRAGGTSPASGVDVALGTPGAPSRLVRTGADGRYTIPDIPLGSFDLVATDPTNGDTGRTGGVVSSVAPVTADITLNGVGQVRVIVRKPNGEPAPGALVSVASSARPAAYTDTAGADGTVVVPNVLAGSLTVAADLWASFTRGQATASLAPGQSLEVVITLGPAGVLRGRVLAPDGVTPVSGATLRTHTLFHGVSHAVHTTSGEDGRYQFGELTLANYYLTALVGGRVRAQSPLLTLGSSGQVVEQDLVLVGVGAVSGVVTDPAGAPVTGAAVRLQVGGGLYYGTFSTTSAAGGSYSLADIPMGPFTITAAREAQGQNVDRSSAVEHHGQALTINLQLLGSAVTLPYTLTDGNLMAWHVQADGAFNGVGSAVAAAERALKLSVVENGTVRPFAGAGTTAASEHEKREIVVRQQGLAGLNVTRKTLVANTGYFSRSLEVLENPGAAAVTVDVVLDSQFGSSLVPAPVDSSGGDAAAGADDDWVVVDDSVTLDYYTASTGQFPPVGIVFSGPGGQRPSAVTWDSASRRLTTRWNAVTLLPGQKAGFVTFVTPQADRARARASAQRLAQMPPEALFGLTTDEAASVRNTVVPTDLASTVAPLPPMDGVVSGTVLSGDGQTAVPGARVTVRSRSPHYGRPWDNGYPASASGAFVLYGTLTEGIKLLPRMEFDLHAVEPHHGLVHSVPGRFADAGVRNLADVPGRSIVASSQDSYGAPANAVDGRLTTQWQAIWGDSAEPPYRRIPFLEVALPGEAVVREVRLRCGMQAAAHVIRRARVEVRGAGGAVLRSTEVTVPQETCAAAVPVDPPVAGVRAVRIDVLADGGTPSIVELEIMGEGAFGPSRHARQDVVFSGRGALEGRLLRSDQTAIGGGQVAVAGGPSTVTMAVDGAGQYRVPVIAPGAYTLTAAHPLGGHSVTVPNVAVAADQKTTQDIVFADLGRLTGATLSAGGLPVNATHEITGPGLTRRLSSPATSYTFADLPAGSYTLTSTGPGSAVVTTPLTIVTDATTTRNVTFPPLGSVKVTATVNGLPLHNGKVSWRSASRPDRVDAPSTNPAGQVTIPSVPGPTFTVRVEYPGNPSSFGEASGAITADAQEVPVSVAVPGLGTVTGTVRSGDGVPQANAAVTILNAAGTTQLAAVQANASGQFTAANVPAVPFQLRSRVTHAYSSGQVTDAAEVTGALTSHGQTLSMDGLVSRGVLTAARPSALWEYPLAQGAAGEIQAIGHALGADAPALVDPRLEVYGPTGALVASNDDRTPSDKNPQVQFTAPQAGTYLAVVKGTAAGGYRLGAWSVDRVFRPYVGATVTGRVLRQGTGGAVAGATVRLAASHAGGLSVTATATTIADGSFSFAAVPANASVTVELVEGGSAVARSSGTSGAAGTSLDLPLTRPGLGQVEVRTSYRGSPFPSVAVEVRSDNTFATPGAATQAGVTGAEGRWMASPVPAGTVTARATDPIGGGPLEAASTLADGGALVLSLTLSDGGDSTPPAVVADLAATRPHLGVVRLTWTAPGDDGAGGTAAAYDLRYSTVPIDAAAFAAATTAPAPAPGVAGTLQTYDLTGLSPEATYYFALKARDEAHNWSDVSNIAQARRSSVPAQGLKLWLEADAGVVTAPGGGYVTSWQDRSGANNHAVQAVAGSQPLRVEGAVNGLPVLRFDGTDDWLSFTTPLTAARTVFWVVRESSGAPAGPRFLLGDPTTYHFHAGDTRQIWSPSWASPSVLGGETRLNGALVNGVTANRPTAMAVLSLVTTGPVSAGSFSRDRGLGRYWWGDLAALIVYDRALGDAERAAVEAYLARKYALYVPALPAPAAIPAGGRVSGPTIVTLQGQEGAELRYTLDGADPAAASPLYTEPLAVTPPVTLKAAAFAAGWSPSPVTTVTFLSAGDFTPASVAGLRLWVRADAGVSGSPAARVDQWMDQSGQGNHLTQDNVIRRPSVLPNTVAGLPSVRFDGIDDWLGFATRIANARTVFWVVRESATATPGYHYLLGDTSGLPWRSGPSRQIWGSGAHAGVLGGQTRMNGAVVNGTTTNRPTGLSVVSIVASGNVPAASFAWDAGYLAYSWWGDLAELAIYDTALSDADRIAVEQYLAARYGITLP